ncbi:Catabolite control protein A [Vibrio aerogenes CECT 7868]|uniref:Catabolite control protein A n=1 Tax=Vibrio aerogenes CECT 7868 TaxID=1216006 RepID=A0A1M6A8W5_9VIBR|nr:substrate-binding domain-containing protein [Vibrio aerogenes]SHI32900.1 Catabolite control protein A [Vibrio aerogenes CECT 7868]
MSQKPIASAAEVARLAGVSRSAVSRTFTAGASVSKETREKVMWAAEQLNYHVNHLARGLSKVESRPVCILGADLNAPYQAKLLDTLTKQLQAANRAVMLINTDGDKDNINRALQQTLNYRAAATIVLSGTPGSEFVQSCIQSGQHVILINRNGQFEGSDHIQLDYSSAISEAHHMLTRAGCKKLAVVSSTIQSPSLLTRENLFRQCLSDDQTCELVRLGPTCYDSGAKAARQLLASSQRPDGVFCVTDLLACGFLDVAGKEFGLSVPDELCVVGFDDIEQASWEGYQLTTFSQPLEDMAGAIIARLKAVSGGEAQGKTLSFPAPLVWRNTVRFKK